MPNNPQHPPQPGTAPALPPRSKAPKLLLQSLTFLLGVALLTYAASVAFGPQNREHLAKLKDAPLSSILALVGLSLASLLLNGLIFVVTLRPVQRISTPGMVATNALAAFLAYLPFKLSLFLRVAIHTRRDRVPLARLGAWFASVAVTLLATVGTLAALARLRPTIDAVWVLMALGALIVVGSAIVLVARLFAGERGLARLRSFIPGSDHSFPARFGRSERFLQLHSATAMLGSPTHVGLSMTLRVADIAIQAARVPIAAAILGHTLAYTDAFLIASSAFVVGILSPTGPVGSREVTVMTVCEWLAIPEAESFAIVALLVSAAEAAAYGLGALLGLIFLGPTRLFTPPTSAQVAPPETAKVRSLL